MKIRDNLSSVVASTGQKNQPNSFKFQTGKVYGIIQNETTPSPELFKQYDGWNGLGTIFYLNYDNARNIDDIDLSKCKIAKPLFPNQKYYPLIGELILLFDLPSYSTQIYQNSIQTYYISPINIWNNNHHNAQPTSNTLRLGKSFQENSNINTLYPFEGDFILEGRVGNSIRFGSTSKYYNNINPWSNSGDNGDPITLITNGHKFDKNILLPYIENINDDNSSIYLTSTQTIPLINDKVDINKLTLPISVDKYNNSQAIINSNRVVINSNKDEVLIFAKTNIELSTKNIVNINADERIHLNSSKIFLGTKSNGDLPDEPILLGNQTVQLLNDVFTELSDFCSSLSSAVTPSEGSPLIDINVAATQLNTRLQTFLSTLKTIYSKSSYTI